MPLLRPRPYFQLAAYISLWCWIVPADAADNIEAQSVLIRLIDQVDVPARTAGVLSSIRFVEGQSVSEGVLVAQVDATEMRLIEQQRRIELKLALQQTTNDVAVRSAKTSLTFARTDYSRFKEAADARPQSISETELDSLKLKLAQAAFNLEDARRKLVLAKATLELRENDARLSRFHVQLREIKAPISGVITQVMRRVGEWVEPGDPVMRIVNVDRLRAEAFLRVKDLTGNLEGVRVAIHVPIDASRTREYRGKITFVHPEVDPVNEQLRVWADVENRDGSLRPGTRARMTVYQVPEPNDTGDPKESRHELPSVGHSRTSSSR